MKHGNYSMLALIIVLILLDIATKLWAENTLTDTTLEIISGIFSLHYVQNTGIAFSIPVTGMLLKILTVILIFALMWYYWTHERKKQSILLNLGYTLVFAGALGNAWERIFRGYVTDFLSLEYFAVFNLADSYITLGAIAVGIYYFFYE